MAGWFSFTGRHPHVKQCFRGLRPNKVNQSVQLHRLSSFENVYKTSITIRADLRLCAVCRWILTRFLMAWPLYIKNYFNSSRASGDFCSLLITFTNGLDLDQDRDTSVLVWIKLFDTDSVRERTFWKRLFWKIQQTTTKAWKIPSMQSVKATLHPVLSQNPGSITTAHACSLSDPYWHGAPFNPVT